MNYLEQIQRGVDYIEANLGSAISISGTAREAGFGMRFDRPVGQVDLMK